MISRMMDSNPPSPAGPHKALDEEAAYGVHRPCASLSALVHAVPRLQPLRWGLVQTHPLAAVRFLRA